MSIKGKHMPWRNVHKHQWEWKQIKYSW